MATEVKATVSQIIERTYNVKSVRLKTEEEVAFKAGQFMSVTLESVEEQQRYLSLSNSPTEIGYLEFTKKITESDFSKFLDNLKPGANVKIKYPLGNFTLEDHPARKIAFLSGGIGITPIRSICKDTADRKLDSDIVLLYANRSVKDIVFKEDFAAMQNSGLKIKVVHVLGEEAPGLDCVVGKIDSGLITKEIADYTERKFFLCGPPSMVEAMRKILSEELYVSADNIVTENFKGYW
jgi:glycine betaine catabolism B